MPGAGVALTAFFAQGALAVGVSSTSAVLFGVAATQALQYYAVSALLNKAIGALSRRGKTGETSGLETSITDSTANSRIIIGQVRVGGVNMIPANWISGTDARYQHQVLAIAAHECDSLQTVYFDQEAIPTPGAITGALTDGVIGSGTYQNAAWVRFYTGTMTQNVDFILNSYFPTQWGTTARGRGWAYVALTYDWGKGKIYRGLPQPTFVVRGAKLYDPRLDSTNGGSGSHRYATPSTWTYSTNPVLAWATHRIASWGYALDPATKIDWTTVAAAADICDASVANKDGGTQARYTINGMFENDPDGLNDISDAMVDACLGHVTNVGGKWQIYAGGWAVPTYTIAKADWLQIDDIQVVGGRDAGRFNEVRSFYVDPNRNWQRVECYPRRNTTYLSNDASLRIALETEQPFCIDESECQRKAEFLLRQSRNGIKLVGTLPPRFHKLKTFDTVALTFEELAWASKTFRILAMTLNIDGSVRVSLGEEQDTDWTDLITANYGTVSTASAPTTNPTTPGIPVSLSVTQTNVLGTLLFEIGEPAVVPRGTRYQIWRSAVSTGPPQSGNLVYDGSDLKADIYAPSSLHYYFARSYANSYFSANYPGSVGIPAISVLRVNSYTAVTSVGLSSRIVVCVATVTPDWDGVLNIIATGDGKSSFDEDSGSRAGAVCAPWSYIRDEGLGILQAQVSSIAALNASNFGGAARFYPNTDWKTVTSKLVTNVSSGQTYALGWYVEFAAGTMRINNARVEYEILRA